ncbi:MAG: chromosome partitioning ATPase [Pseudomonadales bacterium 32-61-5]|nr:MAG: chromosome partitioning ATPase [Pseudomonadales bacterium 32-61-5]
MRRIAFVQQKGGVGKTSLAIHGACALADLGHKTLLVDMDPQGSIVAWYEHASDLPNKLSVSTCDSAHALDDLTGFSYVIIDTPGRLSAAVLAHCEAVVLPIVPSPLDIWAAADSVALVKAQKAKTPSLRAALVVNRMQQNTHLGREVFEVIKGYELPLFPKAVRQRTIYATSLATGGYAKTEEMTDFAKNLIKLSK